MRASVLKWAAIIFALFHVYNNWFTAVSELWFAAIHFGGFGALCALSYHQPQSAVNKFGMRDATNIFLAVLSISVAIYLILFEIENLRSYYILIIFEMNSLNQDDSRFVYNFFAVKFFLAK